MDSLLARCVWSALALVSLAWIPSCSSVPPRDQAFHIPPSVTGRPRFTGSAPTYSVVTDVHVNQAPLDVQQGNTWTIEVRGTGSNQPTLTPAELAQLEASAPRGRKPGLMASCKATDLTAVDRVAATWAYYIVVVDVFEMTGDDDDIVVETARYCHAFENNVTPPKAEDILECGDAPGAGKSAASQLPHWPVRPVNPSMSGRPKFDTAGKIYFDATHPLLVAGTKVEGNTVTVSAWGAYVPTGPSDPESVMKKANILFEAVPETPSSKTLFQVHVATSNSLAPTSSTTNFCLLVKVEETDQLTKVVIDTVYLAQWFTPRIEAP